MSSAIEKNSKNSKAIKVAVIDSGIDWTHPDLENHVDISHGFNFIDHSNNAKDDNGHGTHVAGIIAANCNNIVGTCGIMRNAILLPLKFLTFDGKGTTFGAVEAIEYAVKMKVDIINASWGSFENSQSLKDAIKDAQDAGILFVTASGNYSANNDLFPEYPASFPLDNIISVTATDEFDRLDDFANFGGHSVHVAAPGKNILSTYLGGKYESLSGTSMATPIVTGMLGLLKQYHPQSNFIELKNSLINGCFKNDVLSDKVICKGRVDLRKSLGNFLK
jgi:subtilisin family serine protease